MILLPLYPQYSSTTTGSSLNEWQRLFHDNIPVHNVGPFYQHPTYLEAVVEKVDEALSRFDFPAQAEIVFSAHSIPMSIVAKGDPYQRQIEDTVRLLMERGGWPNRHRLCYQSKVGASKWLQPSLHRTLRDLAAEKMREVCVVPVAFVSDHVETLVYSPGIYETKGWNYRTRQTANPHCHHFGAGADRTIIRLVGTSQAATDGVIFAADYDATVDGFELHDLTLDCNASANPKFRDGIGAVEAVPRCQRGGNGQMASYRQFEHDSVRG